MENETTLTGRGGAGRGQGRKPLAEDTKRFCFLMSEEQRAKLELLGNANFLRGAIDAAEEPAPEDREGNE